MKVISNELFFAQVEELLAEGQSVVIRVKGYSMRPFMRSERTQVRIAPISDSKRENLSVGDIVLFRYRGRHIMHRIRRIDGDKITLAGGTAAVAVQTTVLHFINIHHIACGLVNAPIQMGSVQMLDVDEAFIHRNHRLYEMDNKIVQ